jgi:hypothetical protein
VAAPGSASALRSEADQSASETETETLSASETETASGSASETETVLASAGPASWSASGSVQAPEGSG